MIDWFFTAVKFAALIVFGLLIMGLVGLGYAMAVFSWQRIRELWRRE